MTDRSAAILAHASALIALVATATWLPFLGPLIIWYLKKDESGIARPAAAKSFNFNLGMAILGIVASIFAITIILLPVAAILWFCEIVLTLYHSIRAIFAANRDQIYEYPFQLKILA